MAKKYAGMSIGILISGLALYFVFRDLDLALLTKELKRFNLIYLPLLILAFSIQLLIRGYRWRYLLPNGLELSVWKLTEACIVGFFASFVLPLRAGEFARPFALSRWQPVSFTAGFASVVTERVFDVLALLVMLGFCLPHLEKAPEFVIVGAKLLAAIAGIIILLMLLAYLKAEALLSFTEKVLDKTIKSRYLALSEKVLLLAEEFISGLKAISSFGELCLVLMWSLILWLFNAVMYLAGLWSFGVFPSFIVGVVVSVLIALAVAAPSAPGFLGTFQIGCVAALTGIFGYTQELSTAYSVVLHAFQVVFIVCVACGSSQSRGTAIWRTALLSQC